MAIFKTGTTPPEEKVSFPDILRDYRIRLQASGLSPDLLACSIRTVRHFLTWLVASGIGIGMLDIRLLDRFLHHDCTCPGPLGYFHNRRRAREHLNRFLGFLLKTGRVEMPTEIETGSGVVESFLEAQHRQGYASDSITHSRSVCRHLIVWLYLREIALAEVDDEVLHRFLSHECHCAHPHFLRRPSRFVGSVTSRTRIRGFLGFLIRTRTVPPRPILTREQPEPELTEFLHWLRRFRGVSEATIGHSRRRMRVLLPHLGEKPEQYTAGRIREVVQLRLETATRSLVRHEASTLRSYLRFLATEGLCRPGLDRAVPTIPSQRFSTLPRHLPRKDIETILGSCDRGTPAGRRNHTILLLLARLALRAGEVAHLRLGDIDWDRAVIRVSGKSRRTVALPLPQDVGDALRDYLLQVRPAMDSDRVFLSIRPPFRPLSSDGVSSVAKAAIRRSGVPAEGLPPAHVFRHSAATNLLRDSTPLEVISTLLRHRSVQTTAVYARVDVPMLQEVAQPWPWAGGAR